MVKSERSLSLYSKETQMSQSLHVCKICGKKFATPKAVYGHQRIHSGKSNRLEDENVLQRIWGLEESRDCLISTSGNETTMESESLDPLRREYKATSSLSLKESSSFMTETEEHEMNEAAMSLVMLSERIAVIKDLSPGDIAMDLELKSMQKKVIHCVESKQELNEVVSHSGFKKFTTCSDDVAQALPESNSSYTCKICDKSFVCSQALGGHQTLHRSIKDQLVRKRTTFETD